MKYHFRFHKEDKGYWAECVELKGCVTQADSMEELYENMKIALNLYIYEEEDSKSTAELPKKNVPGNNIVKVSVDPNIAFSFLMRYYRIKSKLTQKQAAKKLGYTNLYNYQRLENKKANPTLMMLNKIHLLYPDFSIDYALN